MTAIAKSKQAPAPAAPTIVVPDPAAGQARLKWLGGSQSDPFNTVVANQALDALWRPDTASDEAKQKQISATAAALGGIGPQDEAEGMLAAQMIAAHSAAMECYRRAMIPEQPGAARNENLSQANKLSRTYATLMEALDRHRGKGQQKVTVEHVHVHSGGQAVVGAVQAGGGGGAGN